MIGWQEGLTTVVEVLVDIFLLLILVIVDFITAVVVLVNILVGVDTTKVIVCRSLDSSLYLPSSIFKSKL